MKEIVVAYDFSSFAKRALALAMQGYPFGKDVVLKLVHVIDERLYNNVLSRGHVPDEEAVVSYLRDDVARVRAGLAALGEGLLDPVFHIARGRPSEQVMGAAKETHSQAILAGGQGHGGVKEFFLGRTARRLLRHAEIPVYVVKDPAERPVPRRVLCAVDFSEASEKALCEAARLAELGGLTLTLLHVGENPYIPYLQRVAAEIHDEATVRKLLGEERGRLVQFEKDVLGQPKADTHLALFGVTVEAIASQAVAVAAGTIIVGSHGHTPAGRLFLGSITEGLVMKSPIDVLVVR